MDLWECFRKRKRNFEAFCFPSKRSFTYLFVFLFLVLYLFPHFTHLYSSSNKRFSDPLNRCIEDKLASFYYEINEFNALIRSSADDNSFIPFIGNGYFGLSIFPESSILLKSSRSLSLPINWHPVVSVFTEGVSKQIVATHLVSGIVNRYQCFDNGILISSYYYAHRTIPYFFSQELKIINPDSYEREIFLTQQDVSTVPNTLKTERVSIGVKDKDYILIHGSVNDEVLNNENKLRIVCIVTKEVPKSLKILPQQTLTLEVPTVIFTRTVSHAEYLKEEETSHQKCLEVMTELKNTPASKLKDDHVKVWSHLWQSGFGVSYSKAAGAINGDRINATLYYVTSHMRSYPENIETGVDKSDPFLFSAPNHLDTHIGCYGGHYHTLQAMMNLWGALETLEDVNKIVSFWLLTLEKQGCHKLISTGAVGLIQAMLLSFGGFRFISHHLELTIHPKFLHRDYFFRRISYGKNTFLNVSVTLQDNNKALLGVSVEGNNQTYLACDGGCIDDPSQLGLVPQYFPVKQTDPITAILFITPDRKHIESIKHTLHVKEVVEAPAHERHLIALHKHGHHLGGLPTLFWALVCSLIIIFHLFLFKLIYNEYCGKQDRVKFRSRM